VVLDNLYAYGPPHGHSLLETMAAHPTSKKSATRAAMTDTLLRAHRAGQVDVAIGRASDYFGPGATNTALGEIGAVRGAINAVAGLVVLRVHGPWALMPAELWSALAGLVLASIVVGSLRSKARPVGPERRRWASVASAGFAALVLLAAVWSG
jgi:hypothetical protein